MCVCACVCVDGISSSRSCLVRWAVLKNKERKKRGQGCRAGHCVAWSNLKAKPSFVQQQRRRHDTWRTFFLFFPSLSPCLPLFALLKDLMRFPTDKKKYKKMLKHSIENEFGTTLNFRKILNSIIATRAPILL